MGGTASICPFCRKECAYGGVKDHVKAKHPEKVKEWFASGQPPYWRYNEHGELLTNPLRVPKCDCEDVGPCEHERVRAAKTFLTKLPGVER